MHSWSNKADGFKFLVEKGLSWSPCCDKDSDTKGCSWDKPKEITNGAYKGTGYEIACGFDDAGEMTNDIALECWEGSPPHLDMMLNRRNWADNKWRAIGAGISTHYAVVWFGEESDPASSPSFFDFE